MREITLAAVQGCPYPGSRERAVEAHLERLADLAARERPDLVVLSELATCPYFCTLDDPGYLDLAEPLDGPTVTAFSDAAREHGTALVATLFERDERAGGTRFFNSAVLLTRSGEVAGVYRKVHLPKLASPGLTTDEKRWFQPGDGFPVFEADGVKIGMLICYDRSFPEAWRSLQLAGAEVIAVPICTWSFRRGIFQAELAVSAHQTHTFVVGVNKAGSEQLPGEPAPRVHFGLSCIADPFGEVVASAGEAPLETIAARVELDRRAEAYELLDWSRDRRPELYGAVTARPV